MRSPITIKMQRKIPTIRSSNAIVTSILNAEKKNAEKISNNHTTRTSLKILIRVLWYIELGRMVLSVQIAERNSQYGGMRTTLSYQMRNTVSAVIEHHSLLESHLD